MCYPLNQSELMEHYFKLKQCFCTHVCIFSSVLALALLLLALLHFFICLLFLIDFSEYYFCSFFVTVEALHCCSRLFLLLFDFFAH